MCKLRTHCLTVEMLVTFEDGELWVVAFCPECLQTRMRKPCKGDEALPLITPVDPGIILADDGDQRSVAA